MKHMLSKILLLFFSFSSLAWSESLIIEADRQKIEMGDIIVLTITADFQTYTARPDFEKLTSQFEILGQQQSNQMQYVNGQVAVSTQWHLRITPKQIGKLMIPPLAVSGVESQPYPIEVSPQVQASGQAKLHFLEAEIDNATPYVQEQVLYTVRFYHQGRLLSGNIRPPEFSSAFSKQIGNQKRYQKYLHGKLYEVYEWHYAFFPQRSGQMTLTPQDFTGRLQVRNGMKQVNDKSQPIHLKVLPKPSSFPTSNDWMIAKDLMLKHEWQAADNLEQGDAITLTLTLQADGLLANQLPNIKLPESTAYQTYPDNPTVDERVTTQGVLSSKAIKIAVIPNQAGIFKTPSLKLPWFNSQTEKMNYLELPSQTFRFEENPTLTKEEVRSEKISEEKKQTQSNTAEDAASFNIWWIAAILFALLWIVTMILLFKVMRSKRNTSKENRETAMAMVEIAKETNHHRNEVLQEAMSAQTPETNSRQGENHAWSPYDDLNHICADKLEPLVKYNALRNWRQKHQDLSISEQDWQSAIAPLKSHLFNQTDFGLAEQESMCQALAKLQQKIDSDKALQNNKKKGQTLEPLYPE